MEVTKKNFSDVLSTLPDILKSAHFITVDTEFTGLRLEGESIITKFDTLDEYYVKESARTNQFLAVQVGLVAWYYDINTNRYSHTAFNFYVYPQNHNYDSETFSCQFSSISVLAKHGFDFNKLFLEGIPYLTNEKYQKKLQFINEKYVSIKNEIEKKEIPTVPIAHKKTIDNTLLLVEQLLNSTDSSVQIPMCFSFVRRLIRNAIYTSYGDVLCVLVNDDETMTVFKSEYEGHQQAALKQQMETEIQALNELMGFTKVVKLIMASGKLLVGHNLFKDLAYLLKFVQKLPDQYSEFKAIINHAFPRVIDTKYMSTESKCPNTGLMQLYELFREEGELPQVEVELAGYTPSDTRLHEAAYDAYVTGLCFIVLTDKLGKKNFTNIHQTLADSVLLLPLLNKLSVGRFDDVPYLNVAGADVTPDRSHIFHMTFPKEWGRDDIIRAIKKYYPGMITVHFIDDVTAYIAIQKSDVKVFIDKLVRPKKYEMMTYKQFKMGKNEPLPLVEKRAAVEEDVGEVVARPHKKK